MSTSGLRVTRISRISQYPSVPIVRWCIGDEHPGALPGAKFTSRLEMDNVPRHPKAANCGSVFGGPMPSHSEYVEMNFAPGKSPGCSSPMHQRTMGTLGYWEIREIRVTRRPEVLIFRTGTTPPALRVTDWVGSEEFQRVVADLRNAYQAWKSRHPEVK